MTDVPLRPADHPLDRLLSKYKKPSSYVLSPSKNMAPQWSTLVPHGSAAAMETLLKGSRGVQVVVHKQLDMTRAPSSTGSVRRASAAATAASGDMRRAAAMAEAQQMMQPPMESPPSSAAREKTALLRQV